MILRVRELRCIGVRTSTPHRGREAVPGHRRRRRRLGDGLGRKAPEFERGAKQEGTKVIYIYIYLYLYLYLYLYIYIYMSIICLFINLYVFIYQYKYQYMCMYMYVYVSVYVYMYTDTYMLYVICYML